MGNDQVDKYLYFCEILYHKITHVIIIEIFIYRDRFVNLGHQYYMIHNSLQNIIYKTLKPGGMIDLHTIDILTILMSIYIRIKVEYHANAEYGNPLKTSEKNSTCSSKVNVSNIGKKKKTLPCYFF